MAGIGVGELVIIGSILCFLAGAVGTVVGGVWFLTKKSGTKREDPR